MPLFSIESVPISYHVYFIELSSNLYKTGVHAVDPTNKNKQTRTMFSIQVVVTGQVLMAAAVTRPFCSPTLAFVCETPGRTGAP